MASDAPSAVLVDGRRLPETLPQCLDDVRPPLRFSVEADRQHARPTTLFLTVDVEDAYFDRPILMTGDGVGREYGVFGILDELDAYGLKATFFVNVYEKDRQPDGVVEGVVREISSRGHEVGLHTHPSPVLDFYRRPLFRLSRDAQVNVLRWGVELIAEWTGEPPTSFRAGGYALNDDTFAAMEEVGIKVDSSCFFSSLNNHNKRHSVNALTATGGIIEIPVTSVLRQKSGGELVHRKLDLDWLSVEEMLTALDALAQHGAHCAMFMMHSFSFIEKQTRTLDQTPTPRARFTSRPLFDRYVEVYGSKPKMREAFRSFLSRVAVDPTLQICVLRDALSDLDLCLGAPEIDDIVPIVA